MSPDFKKRLLKPSLRLIQPNSLVVRVNSGEVQEC
jgi:hypothetical protein